MHYKVNELITFIFAVSSFSWRLQENQTSPAGSLLNIQLFLNQIVFLWVLCFPGQNESKFNVTFDNRARNGNFNSFCCVLSYIWIMTNEVSSV